MIWPDCTVETTVSRIKVEERGKSAVFINLDRNPYWKIKVDGCVVKNAIAADWIVAQKNNGAIIVELKGKDVDHAAKQVIATATLWRSKNSRGRLAGLIIATQYPTASPIIQRLQESFRKAFSAKLHVASGRREFRIEALLGRQ